MRIKILPSLFNHLTNPSAWRTTSSYSMSDTLSFSPPDRSPGSKERLGRQNKWEALASHRDSTSRILSPSFPSLLAIDSISFLFFSCSWYSFLGRSDHHILIPRREKISEASKGNGHMESEDCLSSFLHNLFVCFSFFCKPLARALSSPDTCANRQLTPLLAGSHLDNLQFAFPPFLFSFFLFFFFTFLVFFFFFFFCIFLSSLPVLRL